MTVKAKKNYLFTDFCKLRREAGVVNKVIP